MDAEERHDIVEEKTFLDSQGRQVKQFSQVYGKNKNPNIYNGLVTVRIQIPTPHGVSTQQLNLEFHFPPGTMLKGAFETFDEESKKCIESFKAEQKKRMEEKRIVPASSVPDLKVLGPNGKPMG